MALHNDENGAKVRVLSISGVFPEGTVGRIAGCRFVGELTLRVYQVNTTEKVDGLIDGLKTEWYFDRDLENVEEAVSIIETASGAINDVDYEEES